MTNFIIFIALYIIFSMLFNLLNAIKKIYCVFFLIYFQRFFRNSLTNRQKQSSRGVLKKGCSENMQQIYLKTPMPKCDFNKVATQLY